MAETPQEAMAIARRKNPGKVVDVAEAPLHQAAARDPR